jgi:hypothetical protein
MTSELQSSFIHPDSLGDTLDGLNAALFEPSVVPAALYTEVAEWIADRQGLPGSYAGMFAPTGYDYAFGALTFTGEPVRSGAATGHVLSEEACRAIYRLASLGAVKNEGIMEALERARRGIFRRMEQSEVQGQWSGVYCCGMCTVALWRHLQASGEASDQRRLENGLVELRRNRDGEGRWKRFPFFYTLLALGEIELPVVREEILYARITIERSLRRVSRAEEQDQNGFSRRRKIVLERILEKC